MKRPTPMRTKLAAQEIGQSIASWRKLYGLTAQQLAEKANASRDTISRLENGDPSVSLATFLNICNALGVTDTVTAAVDPYETDFGRMRADQTLPQRVRN